MGHLREVSQGHQPGSARLCQVLLTHPVPGIWEGTPQRPSRSRWGSPDFPGPLLPGEVSLPPLPHAQRALALDIWVPGRLAGSQTLGEGPLMSELKDLGLN